MAKVLEERSNGKLPVAAMGEKDEWGKGRQESV